MQRTIHCIIADKNGYINNISPLVAEVLGWRKSKFGNGIVVMGCGMDMCFHTVYSLSRALFPEIGERSGYALNQKMTI